MYDVELDTVHAMPSMGGPGGLRWIGKEAGRRLNLIRKMRDRAAHEQFKSWLHYDELVRTYIDRVYKASEGPLR